MTTHFKTTPTSMPLPPAVRHAAILDSATDFAIIATDLDARITDWNSGAENVLGWNETDMVGQTIDRIFTPEDRAQNRPEVEMATAVAHSSAEDERWHMRADGSRFWASGRLTPLYADARHIGFLKILRDQTSARLVTEQVHASEAKWRSTFDRLVEALMIGEVVRDVQGQVVDWRYLEVNPAWERMTGATREQVFGRTVRDVIPGVENAWIDEFANVVDTGEPAAFVREVGVWSRWFEGRSFPLGHDRFGCLCFEVTDRRKDNARRDTLLALDERIRDLSDPGEIAFAAAQVLGEMLGASRAGYGDVDEQAETIKIERDWNAKNVISLVGTHRYRDFGSFVDELKKGNLVAINDTATDRATAASADALKAVGVGSLLNLPVMERGQFVAMLFLNCPTPHTWTPHEIAIVRDVAERTRVAVERRRAEQALHVLAETLQQQVEERTHERDRVWQVSRDMLGVADTDGVWLSVNPAWCDILGWPEKAFVGKTSEWLEHPDDRSKTRQEIGNIADGNPTMFFENRFRTIDGDYRSLSWSAVAVADRLYCVARDVTEQKQRDAALLEAEDRLRQSQKVEAVGQLTGGVAHDFNNLLTVIRGSIDLLRRPGLAPEKRTRYLDAISDTADRAARLTSQLLSFARRQALKPETFDAGASIETLREMLGTLTGSRVAVEIEMDSGPSLVRVDRSQFDTAIVNMAVNARDAMSGTGTLTIGVRAANAIPPHRTHPVVPGQFIAVSITDTGIGIADDQIERIFEPFYTTKGVGHGTGLGLSQVFGFAKQSSGDILVRSTVGRGTTFTLYLPKAHEDELQSTLVPEAVSPLPKGAFILVVEDNSEVGSFATRALAELGYRTQLAVDAASALVELGSDGAGFDLVFSDVVMPGMSGIELGQEIHRRMPHLPVVLTSGYSNVLAEQDRHEFELLQKPYSLEELARVLAKVSASRRPIN
ncbi:PAS domain S-box protein [Xanthomonas arboricola]|uniref:PAS domain S-box protein n=1 Tax=Xanthomonas arboricola TaxID=56448 RepID=UPI00069C87EA|nr:PAS domain S-box protein [Xanthomonas arboricola]MBB3848768.1 PAS domain S-box-containing protein [Xanthomonas arboricola]PPT23822.1 hybrid sensor histidine kinase/response regulator [Xanthomonas arboricola]